MSDEYQPDDVVEIQPEDMAVSEATASETAVLSHSPEVAGIPDVAEPPVSSSATSPTTAVPSVVSLADLDSSPSPRKNAIPSLGGIGQVFQGRTWLVGVLIAVLLIVFLVLPPISLASRIAASGGYTKLTVDNPSLRHSDGLTFISHETANGGIRVKLETVPQVHFNTEMVSKELLPAVENLPEALSPKSPFFMIDVKSKEPVAAELQVDIPNAAEPWETLDLWGWNGESWIWIPSHLDREAFLLIADTPQAPTSVMVMQNPQFALRIATEVAAIPPSGLDATYYGS